MKKLILFVITISMIVSCSEKEKNVESGKAVKGSNENNSKQADAKIEVADKTLRHAAPLGSIVCDYIDDVDPNRQTVFIEFTRDKSKIILKKLSYNDIKPENIEDFSLPMHNMGRKVVTLKVDQSVVDSNLTAILK